MPFTNGHALIIGVGQYQHMSNYNVPIAARDAEAVRAVLQDPALCGYPTEQVTLLTNEKATRAAVLSALEELAEKLSAESTLFLFFVGHGVYGTDGNYYLTTHDSQLEAKKVKTGTGVSEGELLEALRKVNAQRMLMIFNACHSGELSPNFGAPETDAAFDSLVPPEKVSAALLGTGEGRIIITACRPVQESWIGKGTLSLFTQAVVSGLKGDSLYIAPSGGYISAFNLYEHVYFAAKAAAEKLGLVQEPELTVLRGVGPFPVALYPGVTHLGAFNLDEPLPADTATKTVDPALSQRLFDRSLRNYQATLIGDGAIAQGNGAIAAGARSVVIKGNSSGNVIITGDHNKVKGGQA